MATTPKDTIYVDIDDEITGIIDKVQNSSGKLVALVLPKRASVFQSIVNMKLLKRAADSGKKNIVLITAEAGLLPLAGAAGIHVAKTLSSKPSIPLGPSSIVDSEEEIDEDAPLSTEPDEPGDLNKNQTVGELAGAGAAVGASKLGADELETVSLDNSTPLAAEDAADTKSANKAKKNKSLKVPNFNRFRLIGGILALLLIIIIVGFFILNSSLKKATIDISTNATNVPVNLNLNLSTSADEVNKSSDTLPAQIAQSQKTYSAEVATTGQKNEGNKASGTITVSGGECSGSVPSGIPAGTGVSANSQTYIIEDDITFTPEISNRSCQFVGTDASNSSNGNNIPITAQSGGSAYNVSGVTFTIAGYSNYTATGSASGGTDDMVQTVNQNDITNAENKISSGSSSAVESTLESQLKGEGYSPLDATFTKGTPSISPSSAVGSAVNNVTVTETINYSMFGVYESNLKTLIAGSIDSQINTNSQAILDYGINSAKYTVNSQTNKTAQLTMNTTAIAGPHLNTSSIKSQAAGKKAGDIKSAIMNDANVTNVKVSFSPFWVSSAPSNTAKIKVVIAKPTNK